MAGPSDDATIRSDVSTGGRPALAPRLLLAAAVLMAGLAVAAPGGRGEEPVAAAACAAPFSDGTGAGAVGVLVLPPGHPPIPGIRPEGGAAIRLPPGHPPIDERHRGLPVPARPSNPVFQPPGTVDL